MWIKKVCACLQAQEWATRSPRVSTIADGETIDDDLIIYRRYIFNSNRSNDYVEILTLLHINDVEYVVEPLLPRRLPNVVLIITDPLTKPSDLPQNVDG